jgi:hypothetical protein
VFCSRAEELLDETRGRPALADLPDELRELGVKLRLLRAGLRGATPHPAQAA